MSDGEGGMASAGLKPTTGAPEYDIAIIGGGFFGCALALMMRSVTDRIVILESGPDLMERASAVNQARVHSGLHYPRSFATARRSQRSFSRFSDAFPDCILNDFRMLYAIARDKSHVSARRFAETFRSMGAPIEPASQVETALFDPETIEAVFSIPEWAFDWKKLRRHVVDRLEASGVEVRLGTEVKSVGRIGDRGISVALENGESITAGTVFNSTYAQINAILGRSGLPTLPLKHELAEISLVECPEALKGYGITVMDGPFFSIMPFPAEGAYSLTHVRYTPHYAWTDGNDVPPAYKVADRLPHRTRWRLMAQDAARYLPCAGDVTYLRSLFDVKTVLVRNESDDGRPILFQEHPQIPGLFSVLGGKIDNIFDVFEYLVREREEWSGLSMELLVEK